MRSSIVILLCVGLLVGIFSLVPGARNFAANIIDGNPPQISDLSFSDGELKLQLFDENAGLKDIKVRASQGTISNEIYTENFPSGTKERVITFPFNPRGLGYGEGELSLEVTTNDRALFSNQASVTDTVTVDYNRPRLEILTLQHIVHEGGAELILYRANDTNLKESGVIVGDTVYPGFPFSYLTGDEERNDIFGSLIALPFAFDPEEKVTLFAQDTAGNKVEQKLSFRIGDFQQPEVESRLGDEFLERKIPDLYNDYLNRIGQSGSVDLSSTQGLLEAFRIVNEDFRRILDLELSKLLRGDVTPRKGNGTFIKPMPSATSSNLGEKRTYTYQGKPVSKSVHNGLDLASVKNDKVHAAEDGTIILAKDFGIYGHAVVIDHGLGISSLYGHLDSTFVNVGDSVKEGDELGTSGQTGLAGGDHLHFEIRIRNTPVTPIEWWDPNWIKDNIEGKIKEVMGEIKAEVTAQEKAVSQ